MWGKIITLLIAIPLAGVMIAFAVANRQAVTVSFDPFSSTHPAYAATLPLFIVIFVSLIFGVIIGGFAAWLRQGKWRRVARHLEVDMRAMHQELEIIRRRFAAEQTTGALGRDASQSIIPPPLP
jgi:uncharacterized integral membrane protein